VDTLLSCESRRSDDSTFEQLPHTGHGRSINRLGGDREVNRTTTQQVQFEFSMADTAGETARRLDLDSYAIFDTPPEKCYDAITQLAAEYCDAAACILSFADKTRVWTKSHYGPTVRELPRENSIFEMVIDAAGPVELRDLDSHPAFQRNHLHMRQMHFVSFAAVPVFSAEGRILGMLAVFHQRTDATFSEQQMERLVSMAGMVSTQMELQKVRRCGAWMTTSSYPGPALNDQWPTSDDLLRAVDRREFQLYYQPEVDLVTRRIIGVEALIRWIHPTRGLIPPMDFIPQAEESGIILPIGDWGMAEACRQIQEWNQLDPRNGSLRVFVNLSALQFSRSGLADHVESLLVQSGTPSHQLGLELTESALMTNMSTALNVLGDLRSLGVSLLMDDFGTGYSSLSYLNSFPFDVLKIDRSFVGRMTEGEQPLQIVRTIIELARVLNMGVVAEGIETCEQYRLLRQMGCRFGQGFLFARPVTATAMTDLLQLPGRILPDREGPPSLSVLRSV
jgi:EAL domain-containing protein (putative c-di-GMP-specific phosphodiesterase class I)